MNRIDVIALDLEGTLVSNAVSQIARPGLYGFLEFCRMAVPRCVIFTAVPEARFRAVAAGLAAEGSAPGWFQAIEFVPWGGKVKDLASIPQAAIGRTLLIDDDERYVLPEQRQQWLPIGQFAAPYLPSDTELFRIEHVLETEWRLRGHAGGR